MLAGTYRPASKYRIIRLKEAFKIQIHFVESEIDPTGLVEPALAHVGAAMAYAISATNGKENTSKHLLKT